MSRPLAGRAARTAVVGIVTVAGLGAAPASADSGPKVTVMTRNLFLGGDLTPLISAPDAPSLFAANATLLAQVDRSNFPERAKLIAAEIEQNKPDLVGLQEVALWRTGAFGDSASATEVRYDYLALLMAELRKAGERYEVAVVQHTADMEAPAAGPNGRLDVRFTERDVILVRKGPAKVLRTSSGNFVNNISFPVPALNTTITSTRGWTAADVRLGNRKFRFVNTHLEAYHPGIRVQQAQELLDGPIGATDGEVILAGDLNTGPDLPVPANRQAYFTLTAGRLVDSWPVLHPGDPGPTAGLGDELTAPPSVLRHRIDMIMTRGDITPLKSRLFGVEYKTPDGLWASDHLGHVARLALN